MDFEEEAIEYIKDNLNLIDSNDFKELYDNCAIYTTSIISSFLLEASINPLLYLDKVPRQYLDAQPTINLSLFLTT